MLTVGGSQLLWPQGAATVEGNQVLLGDKKPVVPDWLKSCQLQVIP